MEETTSFVKIWEEGNAQLWTLCSSVESWEIAVMIAPPNRTGWSIVDIDAECLTSRTFAEAVLGEVQEHLKNIGYRLNNDHVKWRWKYDHEANSFRMNLRAPKAITTSLEEE
jgi:hypothetical protein